MTTLKMVMDTAPESQRQRLAFLPHSSASKQYRGVARILRNAAEEEKPTNPEWSAHARVLSDVFEQRHVQSIY